MLGQATETRTLEVLEASDVKCLYEIIKITLAYLKLSIPFKTQQREPWVASEKSVKILHTLCELRPNVPEQYIRGQ